MKAILTVGWSLFALSLLAFSPAHAGMPDEDPLVRDLYHRFRSARLPTVSQMTSTAWECLEHSARRGDFRRRTYHLKFTQDGSALRLGSDPDPYYSDGREWVQTTHLRYSGGHSATLFISFRVDARENLVAEGAAQLSPGLGTHLELRASTAATTSPRAYAISFFDCVPMKSE